MYKLNVSGVELELLYASSITTSHSGDLGLESDVCCGALFF